MKLEILNKFNFIFKFKQIQFHEIGIHELVAHAGPLPPSLRSNGRSDRILFKKKIVVDLKDYRLA